MADTDKENHLQLKDDTNKIVDDIIKEQNLDKIKDLTHLFNIACAKKNILRAVKLNDLMDTVSDKIVERFEKRPDEFSNSDLVSYLQATQNALDRTIKTVNMVDETPTILNQQNNQVNINVGDSETTLDRESRDRVVGAIESFLSRVNSQQNNIDIQTKNNDDDSTDNNLLNTED